ncbi:MAG: transcription termination factor Rho [Balneolaceae bacterium]
MARPRKQKGKKKQQPKGKKNEQVFIPKFLDNKHVRIGGRYHGVVEMNSKGFGFIRKIDFEFGYDPSDPFLVPDQSRYYDLRPGLVLEGEYEEDQRGGRRVHSVEKINGRPPEFWQKVNRFELQTPIMPSRHIPLGFQPDDIELRVMDLIAPIGRGQRALIVAPPRTGKTVLLKKIAKSLTDNHPDLHTAILLVDERPEEVTDFLRTTNAEVFASSNDRPTKSHLRIAEMALGYVKRKAECGDHAVLLIDSITRLGRAYNAAQTNSGRTLSGGLDIRALEIPKKIFGSARNIENGGSLTIIATALIETNSRMDDLIFEEFKGTGNMELVLDRELANDRIFPAINISASGTRNEDKFLMEKLEERNMVRRFLLKKNPKESMQMLLKVLRQTESNEEIFSQLAATT